MVKFENIAGFNLSMIGGKFYFRNQRMRRVAEIGRLWDFYEGIHWSYNSNIPLLPDPNAKNKNNPFRDKKTVNFCYPFVNKLVSFLFGKGVNFVIDNGENKDKIKFIDAVWDDNDRDIRFYEIGQTGTVSGDAFVYVTLDAKNERIRVRVYDERFVDPIWDEEDPSKLKECAIVYPIYERDNTKVDVPGLPAQLGDGEVKVIMRKIVLTNSTIDVFDDDQRLPGYPKKNPLNGEIPVVHIPNMIKSMDNRGISSLKPILHLQQTYNDRFSDINEILEYHAAPITIVKGARVGDLVKGARKVWGGLPKDGDVYNLELSSDLGAALSVLSLIKTHAHEIIGIPERALGSQQAVSNTSGVAIHIEYQPLIDINNMRQGTYGRGLERICYFFLRYAELYPSVARYYGFNKENISGLPPRIKYKVDAVFPDPLPKDELVNLNTIILKVTNKLMSRLDAIKALGNNDPDAVIAQIMKEAKEEMQNGMIEENIQMRPKFKPNPAVLQSNDTPEGATNIQINGKNGEPPEKQEGRIRG